MKNNKGFSLVELIVVIAIMAILAAVAVIGVSVYVPKAQKAADQQMVADVEQALTLYHYSDPVMGNGKAVLVLNVDDDAYTDSDFIDAALTSAYGAEWKSELSLKYDEWNSVFKYSNFNSNDDGMVALLGNVETLTLALGGFLDVAGANDASMTDFNAYMEKMGVNSSAAKADATVFYVADKVSPEKFTGVENTIISNMGNSSDKVFKAVMGDVGASTVAVSTMYALAEGYANFFESGRYTSSLPNGKQPRDVLDDAVAKMAEDPAGVASGEAAFVALFDAFKIMAGANESAVTAYMNKTNGESPMSSDINAFVDVMTQVSAMKDSIINQNKANGVGLGDPNGYFTTQSVKDLVASYAEGGVFVYVEWVDNEIKISSSLEAE